MTNVASNDSQPSSPNDRKRPRRAKAERELRLLLSEKRDWYWRTTTAAIVVRLSPVFLPILLRFTLDPIRDERSMSWLGRQWSPQSLLWLTVTAGIAIAVLRAVATGVFVASAGRYGHYLVARLRSAMYEHILRLPVRYLDRRGTGRVMLRFIGDSDALRSWLSRTRPTVIGDVVLLLALVGAMFVVSWQVALITAAVLPLVGGAVWMLRPQLYQRTLEARRLQARFTGHIESRLRNIRLAKWLDRYQAWRQETRQVALEIAERNAYRDRRAALVEATGQLLTYGLLPVLIALGVLLLWRESISLGRFVAATWIAMHMAVAIQRLTRTLVIREKAMVSIDRILRLLERSAEAGRNSDAPGLQRVEPRIRARDLVFTDTGPGSPQHPLSVDWRGPGCVVLPESLVAADLFDVLLRFRKPQSGSVELGGFDIANVSVKSLRRMIGWVGSGQVVFEGTMQSNLLMARPSLETDELLQRIERLDLGIATPEKWLSQETGANAHELSRDDLYRLALIRALLNRPRVVLIEQLDGVSTELRDRVRACLDEIAASRSLVLCTTPVAERLFGAGAIAV